MYLNDARSVMLPYVIKRLHDGSYVVLNREYKPIGFRVRGWVDYKAYPISVRFKRLTKAVARKLSFDGNEALDYIYLYNDGSIPTDSAAKMRAYLARLAILAALKFEGETPGAPST